MSFKVFFVGPFIDLFPPPHVAGPILIIVFIYFFHSICKDLLLCIYFICKIIIGLLLYGWELAEDIMSLIKWPTNGWWKHWFLIARIEVSESPSKIELPKLSSWRKVTALRAAIVSKLTIDDGRGMISDNAARTSPEEFRTTNPTPVASKFQKQHRQN